jgi:cell division protein FtsW (lipid II flippase)
MERVKTFLNPDQNTASSGYQINQSLVAIGSGGLLGNGFGQSVQKYSRLPEPIGDSIFAVIGEEFGFLGASTLIILFIIFLIDLYEILKKESMVKIFFSFRFKISGFLYLRKYRISLTLIFKSILLFYLYIVLYEVN